MNFNDLFCDKWYICQILDERDDGETLVKKIHGPYKSRKEAMLDACQINFNAWLQHPLLFRKRNQFVIMQVK